jgi:hypothetical protein
VLQNMLLQPNVGFDHVSLDFNTGLDPEGIRLRPAGGIDRLSCWGMTPPPANGLAQKRQNVWRWCFEA